MKQILKQVFHNVLASNIVFGWHKYLLCLEYVLSNRQSVFLWVPTVLLFSLTSSFIRMSSYRGFSRKTKSS